MQYPEISYPLRVFQREINPVGEQGIFEQSDEISLRDIFDFLAGEWKSLLLAAISVMFLAVGGSFLFGGYTVSGLIINANPSNPSNSSNPSNEAFDFVKWKYLQKALPDLAAELVQSIRVKPGDQDQFKQMSRTEWWDKNVVPVFALSKNDSKLLGSISKELQDSSGSLIQYLVVDSSGSTKDGAEKNLATSIEFVRSGSAYLALKGLVLNIDATTARAESDLRKQLLAAEVEMKFLEQKARNLEVLRKRFPGNAVGVGLGGQVLDPKDAGAKYFPIDVQLVAVNSDIYSLEEALARRKNTQVQHKVMRNFLESAVPAVAQMTEGSVLGGELLRLASELRKKLGPDDLIQQQALAGLESSIGAILTPFEGLQTSLNPQARRTSKFALLGALGFLGGGLVMLCIALLRRSLSQSRARDRSALPQTVA